MPLDAQGIWDRSRVLIADEMIERCCSAEIGAARWPFLIRILERPRRSTGLPTDRRRRIYRFRQQAVLPELQSYPPDSGR